ncbi:MAG: LysR family transcriptional regulator [Actinomycetota bacterium]|nr:LysR family transcriptional regulator [Actinomycetota bacterium]
MSKITPKNSAPLRQPTLRQLRAFQAVARHASFSRAASELALTQPALSAAIREMENQLDVVLFERSTHHVSLTAAGQALLPEVAWLINSYTHGVAALHQALAGQASQLRMAALPSAMHLLASPLADWQRHHPEVRLSIRDPLNDDLVAAVQTGEVDIGLGADFDLPPGMDTFTVAEDDLVAVLPRQHRLAQRGPRAALHWRELAGERLALFARGSTYDLAMATLRQLGIALDGADRLLYSESLYSLVRSGLAVGVISRLYTHGLPTGGLVVRALGSPAITRRIVLMARGPQQLRSPIVADCLAHLAHALRVGT